MGDDGRADREPLRYRLMLFDGLFGLFGLFGLWGIDGRGDRVVAEQIVARFRGGLVRS